MNTRDPRRRCAMLAMAAAASLAMAAPSLFAQTTQQDPDTIYFGQTTHRDQPRFWIATPSAELTLRSTYIDTHNSTKGGDSTQSRETLFEEQLTLSTHGYVVHPNLVDFQISVSGGLSQDFLSDNQGSGSSNGTVYGWDISATFLRNQQAPLTLYSRRVHTTIDVPFGATLQTTTMTTGALLNYHTSESTMQLEAFEEQESQSAFGSDQTSYSDRRDVLRGNGISQLSANQSLTWQFDLEQAHYDSDGANNNSDVQSAAGSLTHAVNFGDFNRNSLTSSVGYSKSTGTYQEEHLRWNEHLHLYHTSDFETNYDYTYEQFAYNNQTTDRQAAYADARYRLYKSLTTVGRVSWEDLQSGDSTVETYAADLSLNYRKNVPDGILLADAHGGYQQQRISGSGEQTIVDQSFSFTGVDAIVVTQSNAIASSVLIRDAVTGRTYTPGTDYTVSTTPTGLQVNRTLGGNIVSGQPLLLTYDYGNTNATEIDTELYGLGTSYQITKGPLAGLTPYARFMAQDQSVTGTAVPNAIRDYTVGSYYQINALTLRAEREWYQSTLYPYDAWRFEARVTRKVANDTTLTAGATYTDLQYYQPDLHTQTYSLNATLSRQITTHLSASVYATYADVHADDGSRTQGLEEGLQMDWTQDQMKVYMRVRNSTLNSDVSDQRFLFFQIGLTRTF